MSMRRPNLIFIMADDLGYADLGVTGAHIAPGMDGTPCLDRLAAGGMLFSDGYSNSPVCSPTRFALITGRYQYRVPAGSEEPLAGRARGVEGMGIDPAHPTIPSLLAAAGYSTALFGKWHLGYPPHYGPRKSGYGTFFGALSGGLDYFSHVDRSGVHDLWDNETEVESQTYMTDLITGKTVDYIGTQEADVPFMISVHYTAPHWPWETREDRAESERIGNKVNHMDGGSVATYRRMIAHMDEGVGRIVDALARRGMLEDTLIVFTSDNGGERFSDVWPFIGGKMDLLEGGIRVPLIAHWPARIRAGSKCATPVMTMDWSATFLAAAGVAAHPDYPLDGISLLPLMDDPGWDPGRGLFWRTTHRGQRAVRLGTWKYLRVGEHEYLFDLAQDSHERANLREREPARFAQLKAAWEAWSEDMPGIPPGARASLVFGEADMPRPTH
ncbi:MAG: sulfatase-like hydrolase/transferase [Burkholderiales bacterium]|nr:sulfatase-like hydrolase/transferase [Burkholderiales bacterium]